MSYRHVALSSAYLGASRWYSPAPRAVHLSHACLIYLLTPLVILVSHQAWIQRTAYRTTPSLDTSPPYGWSGARLTLGGRVRSLGFASLAPHPSNLGASHLAPPSPLSPPFPHGRPGCPSPWLKRRSVRRPVDGFSQVLTLRLSVGPFPVRSGGVCRRGFDLVGCTKGKRRTGGWPWGPEQCRDS
ncbi:hypothetical protein DFP72DRAFT_933803, partial [Ephemerocybe angulata]